MQKLDNNSIEKEYRMYIGFFQENRGKYFNKNKNISNLKFML